MIDMKNLLWCLILFLSACSDFLVEDISDRTVRLKSPGDLASIQNSSVTFTWDTISGATYYYLEIVSPSFDSSAILLHSEEVDEPRLNVENIPNGQYEWSVVAGNEGYLTRASYRKFNVGLDSSSLNFLRINPIRPINNKLINENPVAFLWDRIQKANKYRIQIAKPDFSNSSYILLDSTIITDNLNYTLTDGQYLWRVRGEDDFSYTPYVTHSFAVDRIAPGTPVLELPIINQVIQTDTVHFVWKSAIDSSFDSLQVFRDLGLTQLELSQKLNDTTYLWQNVQLNRDYYWRVKSVDGAGNVSPYTQVRKFIQ
jgi:hypothetical protein